MQTLLRFAPPLLLFAGAATAWSRAAGPDVLVLIGMELLVGPDPLDQARATWMALGGLGMLSFLGAILGQLLARDRPPADADEDEEVA